MKKQKIKELVSKCKILPEDQKSDFLTKLDSANDTDTEFLYRKFTDAKKKIENIYIAIAFKNSAEGQSLIKTLLNSIKPV